MFEHDYHNMDLLLKDFVYVAQPSRVIFGESAASVVARELELLGVRRTLVLCGPQQSELLSTIADAIGTSMIGAFANAAMHVPTEIVTEVRQLALDLKADCALAVGGGSTIGLAKALALSSNLPIIAIPTTYAGSEMTPIYGITEFGLKRTGKDERVLPKTVIYDPELTLTLSTTISVNSGMNAIAHAAEGLYARDGNPIMDLFAEEGMRAMVEALPKIKLQPRGIEARSLALYGAWLCGKVLGNVGMAIHHKLCHTLGGSFNLPHAEVHAVMLPHSIAYNARAAPAAIRRMSRALDSAEPAAAIFNLARSLGAASSLKELGMDEASISEAADIATVNPYWNPRPLDPLEIQRLLHRAWHGEPPV